MFPVLRREKTENQELETSNDVEYCDKANRIDYYDSDLIIARENGDKERETEAYLALGLAYKSNNQFPRAIEYFQKGLEIANERQDMRRKEEAYFGLGLAHTLNKQYQIAIEYYEKALNLAKQQEDEGKELEANLGLGHAYRSENKFHTAINYFEKALEIAQKRNSYLQKTEAYFGLGMVQSLNEQYQVAIEYYEKALDIAKQHGIKGKELEANLGLGHAYKLENQFQRAIDYFKKALEIAQKRKNKVQELKLFIELYHVYKLMKQNHMAMECWKEALKLSEKEGFQESNREILDAVDRSCDNRELLCARKLAAEQLLCLGKFYQNKNQNKAAIARYEQAVQIANETDLNDINAEACQHLGNVYTAASEYHIAIKYYQKAREVCPELEVDEMEVESYHCLGYGCFKDGRYKDSIGYYKEVEKLASTIGNKKILFNAYIGLGSAFSETGYFEFSESYFLKALLAATYLNDKSLQRLAHSNIGHLYYKSCKFEDNVQSYLKAVEISHNLVDKRQESITYIKLGESFQQLEQPEKAIESYQKSLNLSKDLKNKGMHARAVHGIRSSFVNIRHDEVAQKYFKLLDELTDYPEEGGTKKALNDEERKEDMDSQESWKWKEGSKMHREKFMELLKYGKRHLNEVKEVNGVRVCCSKEFLIGKGADGTRVYLGLGKDGIERAVKRLPKDVCTPLAEQEMKVLTQLNATESKNVVRYWFLDSESDKDYLFLLLDLCEETLESYVDRETVDNLTTNAREIIRQVLKGLADLHRNPNPILHRDLKPSNILRDVHDRWLLADFGISRILNSDETTYESVPRGTKHWRAAESYPLEGKSADGHVRYKKASDIQVAGMVAYYIVTKGRHPFGEEADQLRNLLDDKPVGLDELKDQVLKDLLSWMLSHKPEKRPSAEQALKHPYLLSKELQFELLCDMGNQPEIKTGNINSNAVRQLNLDSIDWKTLMNADVLTYLCTEFFNGKPRTYNYGSTWTECLRLIRNVNQHWQDRPRPRPQPAAFYLVGDPQECFLKVFSHLPVTVHRIVRSCEWKERPELQKYFK